MIKINRLAFGELMDEFSVRQQLHESLQEILKQGFIFKDGLCIFRFFESNLERADKQFCIDRTGTEMFVNNFHIDSYVKENAFQQACLMAIELSKQIEQLNLGAASIIISTDGEFVKLGFHLNRKGESWLSDDLDSYLENGILVMEAR